MGFVVCVVDMFIQRCRVRLLQFTPFELEDMFGDPMIFKVEGKANVDKSDARSIIRGC